MGKEMVTSAAANKMLRQLQDEKEYLLSIDNESSTYMRVSGYDEQKPDYDYEGIIKDISEINDKICRIKHVINRFNCTTMLPDLDITVDMALIQMAQLNKEKDRLDKMRKRLPVQRYKDAYRPSGSLVEYTCINYDLDKVKADYNDVCDKIRKIQMGLDYINQTEKFELEI